jgi:hypothetical protein
LIVLGKDQIDAGLFEIAVEKQLCIRDDDRTCRSMGRMRRNAFDMGMAIGMRAQAINEILCVEFTSVIQWPPQMVNICIISVF